MNKKIALVLTGGGARGAYQAGVLRGVSEMLPSHYFPFQIITGISAGSVNGAFLACHKGSFSESTQKLWDIWENLEPQDIFLQNKFSIASFAFKAFINSLLGMTLISKWPESLLDNTPLKKLLDREIDPQAIKNRIEKGDLLGVCFSASDFSSGIITSFFEAHSSVKPWIQRNRQGVNTVLSTKHVLASSALPGIFKLVEINGLFYGDGSTRVDFPLVPAIRLGAERIIAIDMRCDKQRKTQFQNEKSRYPGIGEIIASLLNSLYSDALYQDLSRSQLINNLVKKGVTGEKDWREIPSMLFSPSENLSELAEDIYCHLSRSLRRTLDFLGVKKGKNLDLISHLAFEKIYTRKLLALGYKDAIREKDKFVGFIS